MCSRAGAGAATTAANDAGAGASTATGENFGVTTVDDAAAPSFRPPRALPPRPRPAPAAGFRGGVEWLAFREVSSKHVL